MTCTDRDRIILELAVAVRERNDASQDLEAAGTEDERSEAIHVIESGRFHARRLRDLVFDHCLQHGC